MPKVITRVDRLGRCCSRAMDHDRGRASRVTGGNVSRWRREENERETERGYVRTYDYRCWGGARVRRACETRLLVGGRRQQTVSGMRGVCFERVDMIYESLPTTRLSTRGSTLPILPPPLNVSLLRNVALPPLPAVQDLPSLRDLSPAKLGRFIIGRQVNAYAGMRRLSLFIGLRSTAIHAPFTSRVIHRSFLPLSIARFLLFDRALPLDHPPRKAPVYDRSSLIS